jgi:transcription elongation factor SPT4
MDSGDERPEEGAVDLDDARAEGIDEDSKTIPTGLRNLRACMFCSLIKTQEQFYESGCDNCPFLEMAENKERVLHCTSPAFAGFVV